MKKTHVLILMILSSTASSLYTQRIYNRKPIIKIVPSERRTADLWRVTAYCSGSCCCEEFADGITASGYKIKRFDQLVAAPKSIPFHTWIYIPGYSDGHVEVLDRGGSIKGKRLDLLFPDHQSALNWGVQYLEIRL